MTLARSALRMRVLASAPAARAVAGKEEVCCVREGWGGRERGGVGVKRERVRKKEREETQERDKEKEAAATVSSSSCQPGRASTVWNYLGERQMKCEYQGGRGMQRGV